MPIIEIGVNQIKAAIEQLTPHQKAALVETLEKQSWKARFRQLLARMDERLKKHPISIKKIDKIVEEAKTEYYAQNRHRR